VGKPFGEKPTSPAGYDCLRASTGFCVNSQRMSVSEAPVKTGGGDLLPVERLLLLWPLRRYEHLLVVTGSCVLEQLVTLCLVLWAVEDNVFCCLLSLSVVTGGGVSWNFHGCEEGVQPYLLGTNLCYKRAH
jgi:hypothetical protein